MKRMFLVVLCYVFSLCLCGVTIAGNVSTITDKYECKENYSSVQSYGKYIGRHSSYCVFMFEDLNFGTITFVSDEDRSEASWGLVVGQCYVYYYNDTGLTTWCDYHPLEKVRSIDCGYILR